MSFARVAYSAPPSQRQPAPILGAAQCETLKVLEWLEHSHVEEGKWSFQFGKSQPKERGPTQRQMRAMVKMVPFSSTTSPS
eukprot:5238567-Amphidinium_carterae.2